MPLEELGALADRRRQIAKAKDFNGRGNDIVTYIVDRNVNYTNVCNVYCKFCAFYRVEKDDDSYVITLPELDKKIEETIALGGTQMLMQGGHHPKLTKQWYLDLLSHVKNKFPGFQHPRFQPERVHPFPRSVQRAAGKNHFRFQERPASARFPAAAGKFWWTACASEFRRSRR